MTGDINLHIHITSIRIRIRITIRTISITIRTISITIRTISITIINMCRNIIISNNNIQSRMIDKIARSTNTTTTFRRYTFEDVNLNYKRKEEEMKLFPMTP